MAENKLFIALTREERKQGTLTIDAILEGLDGLEGASVINSNKDRGVIVAEYTGTPGELYKKLGYTKEQVHIEPEIQFHPCE